MTNGRKSSRVLVVDDELIQRKVAVRQLEKLGFDSDAVETAAEALELLQKKDFDVVLLDVQMTDMSGLEALPLIRKLQDAPEVIMLTLDKSLESGIAAMRGGAYDYLTKPAEAGALEIAVTRAAEHRRLVRQNSTLRDFVEGKTKQIDAVPTFSAKTLMMREITAQADAVARLNSTVLITGESGTGKDVLARYIHSRSARSKTAMVSVNCGALPETLFESEIFGYEKGAFSGANQTKHGLIEVADGTTLFLDEIGELPIALQVKFLRFLESGEFRRVGATRALFSDTRLIAATNQDLPKAIKENRFRADLYYRLNVIHLHLPPLRERPDDLPVLIDEFLSFYRSQFRKPDLNLSEAARCKLENYDYPGNIRELKNTLERAAALTTGDTIEDEQIIFFDTASRTSSSSLHDAINNMISPSNSFDLPFSSDREIVGLNEIERQYILSVLNYTNGNRERASALLGISERTLYRRLRDYE